MVNIRIIDNTNEMQYPRRLMKYVLIFSLEGDLSIVVDDKELVLKANDILTITSG